MARSAEAMFLLLLSVFGMNGAILLNIRISHTLYSFYRAELASLSCIAQDSNNAGYSNVLSSY